MPEYVDPTDPGFAITAAMQQRAGQPAQRPTPIPGQPDTLSLQAIMDEIDAQTAALVRAGLLPVAIYLSDFAQDVLIESVFPSPRSVATTPIRTIPVHVWGVGGGTLPVQRMPDAAIAQHGDVGVVGKDRRQTGRRSTDRPPGEGLTAGPHHIFAPTAAERAADPTDPANLGFDGIIHPLVIDPTITPEMQSARLKALTGESSDELRRRLARALTDGMRDRETGDRIDADASPST